MSLVSSSYYFFCFENLDFFVFICPNEGPRIVRAVAAVLTLGKRRLFVNLLFKVQFVFKYELNLNLPVLETNSKFYLSKGVGFSFPFD